MRYLDVCSGISAPTMAWKPLGWQALCFAEIEPAPRSVLAHHYPDVPLNGDFTQIRGDEYGPVDLVVGGTPCQDYSIAGLRAGLDGARGNLTLEFSKLAYRARSRWLVWENVPGAFSTNGGRDFGAILATFSGCHGFVFEPPADGWRNSGIVEPAGPGSFGLAWRVLDAQHFGVPQRRRRIFVVGYLGDWRRAAAVLFERHSLQGHPAPRPEAGEGVTPILEAGARTGVSTTDVRAGSGIGDCGDPMFTLQAGKQHAVAHALRAEGFDASEDGTGRGTPLVPVCFSAKDHGGDASDIAPTLRAGGHSGSHANAGVMPAVAFQHFQDSEFGCQEYDTAAIRAGRIPEHSMILKPASAVRRLTPRECERLQGFPDDFTLVPHRGKPMADGPRYKMLGNSMAVPVVRWIGERIQAVEAIAAERAAA